MTLSVQCRKLCLPYLLTGRRIYSVVSLCVLRLVSAPACKQIQENLHGLIEKLLFTAITYQGDCYMTQPVRKEKERFTYDDYLHWNDGRWQIIDGVVYDMSPAPSREHQRIVLELTVKIHGQLEESPCEVYVAPFDVRLPDMDSAKDDEILTVVQPDIVVVCDELKLDDRGCLGAPDLVVEVLSPSTAVLDLKEKRELYERHGVKEYWLVHPADRLLMVYRPDGTGCYQKAAVFGGADIIESSAVAGIRFSLKDIFGKAPAEQPPPSTRERADK